MKSGGTYKSAEEHVAKLVAIRYSVDKILARARIAPGSCTVDEAQCIIIALGNAGFELKKAKAK